MRRSAAAAVLVALSLTACTGGEEGAAPASTTAPHASTTTTTLGCEPIAVTAGEQERVEVTGGPRDGWYFRYVPRAVAAPGERALILDLHGYTEGAQVHVDMSNLDALADEEGFVVVTPQGTGTYPFWNMLQREGGPPDVAFLTAILDEVEAELCIDRRRVYVTGLSNGAFMTSTLGCVLADRIAAIGPVAGVRFEDGCRPSRPLPVLAIHGTADTFVTFDGSPSETAATLPLDEASIDNFTGFEPQAVLDALGLWAEANGCDAEPVEEPLAPDVALVKWTGCDAGADVQLVRVDGGGHTWPGSEFARAIEQFVGHTTMSVSANELLWDFFVAHELEI